MVSIKKRCRSHSGNQRIIHEMDLLSLLFNYSNFFIFFALSVYSAGAVGCFRQRLAEKIISSDWSELNGMEREK